MADLEWLRERLVEAGRGDGGRGRHWVAVSVEPYLRVLVECGGGAREIEGDAAGIGAYLELAAERAPGCRYRLTVAVDGDSA